MNVKKIVFATLIISTVSYALPTFAGSCEKQGSSVSISKITSKYKNCVNCGTKKDSKGKTVYYCYCGDGCKGTPAPTAESLVAGILPSIMSSKPSTTASKPSSSKSSGSCEKKGSSSGVTAITSKYKNCVNCGTQKDSKGKTVYYCYCGDGCKGTPAPTAESLVASFLGPSAITSSKPSTTASKSSSSKSSGSCKKQGSSVSIKAITSKYKNCSNCGTKKDSKGKTVYYCYCGDC